MPGIWDERNGAFVTFIKAQSAITALIGVADACRCWPDVAQSKSPTAPYLIYTRSGGNRFRNLGTVPGAKLPRRTVLNLYSYGDTRSAADGVMELVLMALDNFRGLWSTVTVNDCKSLMTPVDDYDNSKDASATARFFSRVAFGIIHSEI